MGPQLLKVIVTCAEVADKSPTVFGMGYCFFGFLALVFGDGSFFGQHHDSCSPGFKSRREHQIISMEKV